LTAGRPANAGVAYASALSSRLPLSSRESRSSGPPAGGLRARGWGRPGSIPFAVVAPVSRADRPRRVKRETRALDPPCPACHSGRRGDGGGRGRVGGAGGAGGPWVLRTCHPHHTSPARLWGALGTRPDEPRGGSRAEA